MSGSRISTFAAMALAAIASVALAADADQKKSAEKFLRGVYGCDPAVVDELAGDDIVLSYPIFESLFGEGVIRGREAVKRFAAGFCERWVDAEVTVHEAIEEREKVVLVWSFRARSAGSPTADEAGAGEERGWGGITLYSFDPGGKIVAEIGEESTPGPFARSRLGEPFD